MDLPLNSRSIRAFTLIELIMVIVILGVLSAFALPRFADLSNTARLSALQGVAGSMDATIAITKSVGVASGFSRSAVNLGAGFSLW